MDSKKAFIIDKDTINKIVSNNIEAQEETIPASRVNIMMNAVVDKMNLEIIKLKEGSSQDKEVYTGSVSWALDMIKKGERVARHGTSQFRHLVLMNGYPEGVIANSETIKKHNLVEGSTVIVSSYLACMRLNQAVEPYTLTNEDIVSNDWFIV